MIDLAEGDLPSSNSEVVVWYDEEEDLVQLQLDFLDLNFYAADFGRLVDLLSQAKLNLESHLEEDQ